MTKESCTASLAASITTRDIIKRLRTDDSFCLRYQVFYRSTDCAIRTKFKTSAGCLDCEQGRFNLKRHSSALRRVRFHFALED